MSIRKIFPQNIYKDKIIYLDKKEWQIYYSTKYKYPYLVIEDIKLRFWNKTTKRTNKRTEIEDPLKVRSKKFHLKNHIQKKIMIII